MFGAGATMIERVTIRKFKKFAEQTFEVADSVVLAGPNNSGKSTLLQAIAAWRFGLDRWITERKGAGRPMQRSGVSITRPNFTAVPLRAMNLLWKDRQVSGSNGPGAGGLIEIILEGREGDKPWKCGIEFQYANPESVYVRPCGAKNFTREDMENFPASAAKDLAVVHVPPLSGIERDEPRRELGRQNMLIGEGHPGRILRNLLWEISEEKPEDWETLVSHVGELFGIQLEKPSYSPSQPSIICEYRQFENMRPLFDLASAGSGTLQVLLLLAFLYARPSAVLLLDEPDAHQHIILQRQVYDLVRKIARDRGGQLFVATHSEVILDATEPTRVLNFYGRSPKKLAEKTERDQLREALKCVTTTDLSLGLGIQAVLYVESDTDSRILLEWAKTLEHPARAFLERPFVHWLGGRKIKEAEHHFFAMRAVAGNLRGICLLDGDNRDEDEEEVKRSNLIVLKWRRYEIENYMIHLEALKRFAASPLMQREMEKEFFKQVPEGTDPHGDHVSLVRVKGSQEFLIPMFQNAGLDIPKRDLYMLAAEMRAEEIHPEVRGKLDRIAEHFGAGAQEA